MEGVEGRILFYVVRCVMRCIVDPFSSSFVAEFCVLARGVDRGVYSDFTYNMNHSLDCKAYRSF